jgi:hypothetical protein
MKERSKNKEELALIIREAKDRIMEVKNGKAKKGNKV